MIYFEKHQKCINLRAASLFKISKHLYWTYFSDLNLDSYVSLLLQKAIMASMAMEIAVFFHILKYSFMWELLFYFFLACRRRNICIFRFIIQFPFHFPPIYQPKTFRSEPKKNLFRFSNLNLNKNRTQKTLGNC